MKTLPTLLVAVSLLSFNLNAQDQTTVNVRLFPIQTLVVNSGQKNVNLDYVTKEDYANGVATDQKDHLTIYSTGAFAVNVRAENTLLTSQQAQVTETINASDITITASNGETHPLMGATYNKVGLTVQPELLIESTVGGVNRNVNIEYRAEGNLNSYLNKYFSANTPTVYSTTVIYEIVAQ